MSRPSLRCGLAVALLVLGLSLPAPAVAASSRIRGAEPRGTQQQESPGLLRLFWQALASIWGKDGAQVDPNGGPR